MKLFYRHILLFATILLLLPTATAQVSVLHLESTTIDLGTIAEADGPVTTYIGATNSGTTPIYIKEIVTTCGCTKVEYKRDAIAPNESIKIGITYDPHNRPGRIDKQIIIVVSESSDNIVVRLIGNVTPRERSVYEIYPFDMGGGLRMESNFHSFAYIEHGTQIEERIGYINHSDHTIRVAIRKSESSGALNVIYPTTIAPHGKGDIVLRYTLDEESTRYGTLNDIFQFEVDGVCNATMFSTYAIAVDNFDLVEDILAPCAVISKKIIKFGEILLNNDILELSTTIGNSGETPLIIRRIESDSPAIDVSIEDGTQIGKGESITLRVRLNTALIEDCDNPFVSRIRVICNDPITPMQVIRVNAIPL